MRDDTMWQLYEWQQRQARQSLAAPSGMSYCIVLKVSSDARHCFVFVWISKDLVLKTRSNKTFFFQHVLFMHFSDDGGH